MLLPSIYTYSKPPHTPSLTPQPPTLPPTPPQLANEAALKAALIRTKKMKQIDSKNPPRETLKDKAEWMQQIIEEEQAKPLQVGKDYIIKYEEEEKKNEAALQRQVEHHVNCLKNLRSSIERRETIKERKANFKEFKAQVEAERKAVLEGKVTAANRFKLAQSDQQGGEGSEQEVRARARERARRRWRWCSFFPSPFPFACTLAGARQGEAAQGHPVHRDRFPGQARGAREEDFVARVGQPPRQGEGRSVGAPAEGGWRDVLVRLKLLTP